MNTNNNNQKKTLKLNKTTIMKLNDEMMMRIEGGTDTKTNEISRDKADCTSGNPNDPECLTNYARKNGPKRIVTTVQPQTC